MLLTGKPKVVIIHTRAILNHMIWMQKMSFQQQGDRILQKTPFSSMRLYGISSHLVKWSRIGFYALAQPYILIPRS
ncbi:hypothetical protein CW304_09260 [Bacillus sp. UFRGS-B20]|nr:hypothetical protein CW304_09260 [Bacillus sp. UFRGS-B20]